MTIDRRNFLKGSALAAGASSMPLFAQQLGSRLLPRNDSRILVVVQLDGGNDGINTVVPFGDDAYQRNRRTLRIAPEKLIKLDDHVGLHPAMRPLERLIEDQRLAVVQGVGYPNPNRSHFRSMAIWHSARRDPEEHDGVGWLGRSFDRKRKQPTDDAAAMFIGAGPPPVAVRGARSAATAIERLEDFRLLADADPRNVAGAGDSTEDVKSFVRRSMVDASQMADRIETLSRSKVDSSGYPATRFGRRLQLIAHLLKAEHGARVYYTRQGGYDTHSRQLLTHQNLLGTLSTGLAAFIADLRAARLDDRVVVMAFSEFGRTAVENGSEGTDHGTAGPMLVIAPKVERTLLGKAPDLSDLVDGEPKVGIDFRRVYASVLRDWLDLPTEHALPQAFERLPLFPRG